MKLPRRRNQRKDAAGEAGAADKDADADADADMGEDNKLYGDSKFLAMRDSTIKNLRSSEKDTKHKIIEKMLTLQHNMKYNRHLLSVYMKAKELFDKMVEEHRMQIHSLEEIHHHLNHIIRENLSAKRIRSKKNAVASSSMMTELMKDKKRIGALLKKMRDSYEKLMNVDTVIGVTIQQINEITFMDEGEDAEDDDDDDGEDDDGEDDEEDDEGDDTDEENDEDEEYDDTDEEDDEDEEYEEYEGDSEDEDEDNEDEYEDEYEEEDEDDDIEGGESEDGEDEEDDDIEGGESEDDSEDEDDSDSEDEDEGEEDRLQDNNMFIGVF